MKCIIIEDEAPAAKRLERLLSELRPPVITLCVTDSVETSVEWLKRNPHPDVIFMDIRLADGYSFEIFDQVAVQSPVIFTTAYDEYALKAFEVNSIDYLLKPIDEGRLEKSIAKLNRLQAVSLPFEQLRELTRSFQKPSGYKTRFLIHMPERLMTIDISRVAYFEAKSKLVLLVTFENRHFPADYTLDELQNMIDPVQFFRINRRFLASFQALGGIYPWFNGKLKVDLNPPVKDPVYVSRERSGAFKDWLEGRRS